MKSVLVFDQNVIFIKLTAQVVMKTFMHTTEYLYAVLHFKSSHSEILMLEQNKKLNSTKYFLYLKFK